MAENVEFVLSAKDLASDTFRQVEKSLEGVGEKVFGVKEMFGSLAAVVSVAGFSEFIERTITAEAKLEDLAEVAGTTGSRMAALELPAAKSGTQIEFVASAVAKLSKAVGEAQLGDEGKKSLFRALGMDPNDGKDVVERMLEVSTILLEFTNKNVAAKVSNELLGKSYAEARPFMKHFVEDGIQVSKTTDEDIAAAKRFEDGMATLKHGLSEGSRALANELLPSLNEVVSAMVRAQKEGGMLAAIVAGIQTAATGTDQYKNDKEIVELTQRKLEIQNKIDELRATGEMLTPGVKGDKGPGTIAYWEAELAQLNEQLKTTMSYREVLANPGAVVGAAEASADGHKPKHDKSKAEQDVIAQEQFKKHYAELVATAREGGVSVAAQMRTNNALAQQAYQQGEMDQLEYVRQTAANDDRALAAKVHAAEEELELAKKTHEKDKITAAQRALDRVQAERTAQQLINKARLDTVIQGEANEQAHYKMKLAADMKRIQDENLTQHDQLQQALNDRLFTIQMAEMNEIISAEEAAKQRELVELQHQAKLGSITAQGALERRNFEQMTLRMQVDDVLSTMLAITSGVATHNKTLFEINKVAATANAIVHTAEGATLALAKYPPPLSFVMAAAQVAAGLVQVATIQSQSFNAGGSVSAPTPVFPANPTTGLPAATTAPIAPAPVLPGATSASAPLPPPRQEVNVTLVGKSFSADDVRQLIQQLAEQATYGADITVQTAN